MLLDEFATEVEPQAGSTDAVGLTISCPDKLAEQASLFGLRDADALISNTEQHFLRFALAAQDHLYRPSVWTVFDGVGEQIGEYLLDASFIHVHQQAGEGGGERDLVAVGTWLEPYDHTPAKGHQVDGLTAEHEPSGLETNHIEQILCKAIQAIRRQVDL